jgi:hypothetical protein
MSGFRYLVGTMYKCLWGHNYWKNQKNQTKSSTEEEAKKVPASYSCLNRQV